MQRLKISLLIFLENRNHKIEKIPFARFFLKELGFLSQKRYDDSDFVGAFMQDTLFLFSRLYQLRAIQFGQFTLKSGKISPLYLNFRKMISHPDLIELASHLIYEKMKILSFDYVCGVPYTALPIACSISFKHQIPMVLRRKEKKDYGTKEMIEGDYYLPASCVVIEDVVTTGGSILETAHDLRSVGFDVHHAFSLLNRGQIEQPLASDRVQLHALTDLRSVLTHLLDEKIMENPEEIQIAKQFLNDN